MFLFNTNIFFFYKLQVFGCVTPFEPLGANAEYVVADIKNVSSFVQTGIFNIKIKILGVITAHLV